MRRLVSAFGIAARPRCLFLERRSFFNVAREQPWSVARNLIEDGQPNEAHALLVEAIGSELKEVKLAEGGSSWSLPLLLLELSKSFLKKNEPQDALSTLEHAVNLFEDNFKAGLEGPNPQLSHERYVESLLHLAKLLFVSGQGQPVHLWKTAISHAMKHEGRESYHVLVATLGLGEFYLEQLQLNEADRFIGAAAEHARQLPQTRATRERLVEAIAMQGLGRAQRQDVDGALRFYLQGLKEVDEIEKEAGSLDPWTRTALHNLYRNIEHAYKDTDEEKAKEWKDKRDVRLGTFEKIVLEQPLDMNKDLL
jgi:hypothetical protein